MKSNDRIILEILKSYLRGGTSVKLESEFGRGYIRANQVILEEVLRLEEVFAKDLKT